MTATAAAPTVRERKYPEPLVSFGEDPVGWIRNQAQALLVSIPLSHVMILAWIGIYYLLFEVIHPVKRFWDTLLSHHIDVLSQAHWDTWRHMFRGGGESYLATMVVLFLLFNPYKHKTHAARSVLEIVTRCVLTLVLMIPLFIGLGLLMHHFQQWLHTGVLAPSIGAHPSLAQKLYGDQWTTKIVVFVAGFLGRRPMFPVFAFVLEFFAERRVARGGTDHWWMPAPYRAMIREHAKEGVTEIKRRRAARSRSVTWMVLGVTVVTVAFACYGVYVLEHYAK
jgi:hypothetical protein